MFLIKVSKSDENFPKSKTAHLFSKFVQHSKFAELKESRENVICDAFRDLVLFLEFRKREKHPLKSTTFSKVAAFQHGWEK